MVAEEAERQHAAKEAAKKQQIQEAGRQQAARRQQAEEAEKQQTAQRQVTEQQASEDAAWLDQVAPWNMHQTRNPHATEADCVTSRTSHPRCECSNSSGSFPPIGESFRTVTAVASADTSRNS